MRPEILFLIGFAVGALAEVLVGPLAFVLHVFLANGNLRIAWASAAKTVVVVGSAVAIVVLLLWFILLASVN